LLTTFDFHYFHLRSLAVKWYANHTYFWVNVCLKNVLECLKSAAKVVVKIIYRKALNSQFNIQLHDASLLKSCQPPNTFFSFTEETKQNKDAYTTESLDAWYQMSVYIYKRLSVDQFCWKQINCPQHFVSFEATFEAGLSFMFQMSF